MTEKEIVAAGDQGSGPARVILEVAHGLSIGRALTCDTSARPDSEGTCRLTGGSGMVRSWRGRPSARGTRGGETGYDGRFISV
ncbi:hypothetical protein GCM10010300_83290 [Streptomyces olivaceoviridis]|uniref:hypothetical protein n=1 Tax=Streptomyces olivaceoviridis TaxID=1921 RepID=UPI0016750ADF|nr:hypothetical protein [Streptomyces olivaceoviridis]GGZ27409.1 hypothetical protein GCM10010300_83290 [Streptomyces olivaceoviridis]